MYLSIAKHSISVFFNKIDQISQHLALRSLHLYRICIGSNSRLIVRMMLGKIRIHPNLDLPLLVEKYHLFSDIEIAHLLIEYLEALEAALIEVELIVERYIVYLFQSQLNFAHIQESIVDGGAEFIH